MIEISTRSIIDFHRHAAEEACQNDYRNGRYGNTRWRSVNSRLD